MSKKLSFVIFLLVLFPPLLFSQQVWQRQNEFSITGNMNDIIQFDMRKVISVGDYGQICISEDGGTTMKKIHTGFNNHFKALSFLNQNTGYVCGDGGLVIKTTNGGYNWKKLNTIVKEILFDIQIINTDTIIAVGEQGRIIKSTDGGISWWEKNFNPYCYLISVKFYNATTGNAVGYPGVILRTTNKGENWYEVYSTINFNMQYNDIDTYGDKGICVGDSGVMVKSTDFGNTWTPYFAGFTSFRPFLYRVKMIDSLRLIIGGEMVQYSTNGGINFTNVQWNMQYFTLKGIALKSLDSAFVCGTKSIGKIKNFISTIYIYKIPYAVHNLQDLSVVDGRRCWALSKNEFGIEYPKITFNTTDQGANWNVNRVFNDSSYTFTSIKFINKDTGYISFYNGLFKTVNGGANWNVVYGNNNGYIQSIKGKIKNRLYAKTSGYILYSTNDGINWTKVYGPQTPIDNFAVIDTNFYYCTNKNPTDNIYKTTNGGLNWIQLNHYLANTGWKDMHFINAKTGIFISWSKILKTTNGVTLHKLEINNPDPYLNFNSVHMSDSNTIFIAGNDGIIYNSTNGGYSWELQPSGVTTNLNKVQFYNSKTGWIVGDYGVILFTSTGGKSWTPEPPASLPEKFSLAQNYPNPFNNGTTISFTVPVKNRVAIRIYDITGKKVSELLNEEKEQGTYKINFDAKSLASGIYFYSLSSGNFIETRRMVIIK